MNLIYINISYVQVLHPLRIRTHNPLMWDKWYTSFICQAGFVPLAQLITVRLLMMDSTVLIALVDRWRPEIHTFHLPCGETMVTLQDVTIILGLPIDGTLVCLPVSPGG
jgi:hypothetical protein